MKLWALYRRFPFLEYRHRLVKGLPHNGRLLEAGCSSGDRARLFKTIRPDLEVVASDISDFSTHLPNDIPFVAGDITDRIDALADASFDGVTAMHLFEHLPVESYGAAIAEIKRLLKPGGVVYIETPGIRSLFVPSWPLGVARVNCPLNFRDDPSHVAPFTRSGLYYLLKDHGFQEIRSGIARNLLFALASPLFLIYGLMFRNRQVFTIGVHHLVGWSVFASGRKI